MSVSVQRFTVAGKAYFISLRRKPDLQGGSVDLEVTDGAAAWTASGVRCTDLTGQPTGDELNHFIAALSSELAAEAAPLTKYTINAHAGAPNGDGLNLSVGWRKSDGFMPKATAALQPAVPAGPVVAGILELLVGNVAAATALVHSAQQIREDCLQKVEKYQGLVARYVDTKASQEAELHVKMAALLNSKKIKLREMREENHELRREVEQLRLGREGEVGAAPAAAEAAGAAAAPAPPAAAWPPVHSDEACAMVVDGEHGEQGTGPPPAPSAPQSAPQQQQQQQQQQGGNGGGNGDGRGDSAAEAVESEDDDEAREDEDADYHTDE